MKSITTTSKQVKSYKDKVNKIISKVEEVRPDKHQTLLWVKHYWNRYLSELIEYELYYKLYDLVSNGQDAVQALKELNQTDDIQISTSYFGANNFMNITIFVLDEANSVQFSFSFDFHPKALDHIESTTKWYKLQIESMKERIKRLPSPEFVLDMLEQNPAEDNYHIIAFKLLK